VTHPPAPRHEPLLLEATWFPLESAGGGSFSIRHLQAAVFPFPFHYHPEMELTLIVRGHGRRVVGEVVERFEAGDLVLIGSMLPHVWLSDPAPGGTEAYVLRFDRVALERGLLALPECVAMRDWLARGDPGLAWRQKLPDSWRQGFAQLAGTGSAGRQSAQLLDLLAQLAEAEAGWEAICGPVPGGLRQGRSEQRIGFAVRYLREHFCSEIRQAEVAERLGMSAPAFSRLYRRVMGETFQQTLTSLRIEHACRLLRGTTLPVGEVACEAGYRNLANFNRQFAQAKGMAPRDYRRGSAG